MRIQNVNNDLSIRLATSKDSSAIVLLQYDSIQVLGARDNTPRELEALLKSKSHQRPGNETIFVAEIKGKIVGFAALMKLSRSISGMFVHPDFARQGIGTKLLAKIEQEAVKSNLKKLWVCSSLTGQG